MPETAEAQLGSIKAVLYLHVIYVHPLYCDTELSDEIIVGKGGLGWSTSS